MTKTRKSRVWGDEGVEPDPGEETYEGGEQPIAEYDNWAMWSVTDDIHTLFEWLDTVEDDLEAHIDDDTNPHDVTEEQTGAADSLTSHVENEVHDQPQPAEPHGNEAHTDEFVTSEEGVTSFATGGLEEGQTLVNEDGVLTGRSDTETNIRLIEVAELDDLPSPDDVTDPTIAYVDEEDDYLGVFQE